MSQPVLDYLPDEDGYTLSAYIRENPRIHNEVRFKFRPVDVIERSVLIAFKDRNYEKTITEKFCEVLAARITEWSVHSQSAGAPVPMEISTATVRRLRPSLWIRLVNIVIWGIDGGDVDPTLEVKQMDQQLESDMDAVLAGTPIVEKRVEELRKN
jgi:hypothetical protein